MNSYSASNVQPSHIGHYEIGATLGRGGMGLVYLARDTRLGRQVAIKCLRTDLFEEHYRERFKREAMLLAKLNHPHIVQIYDFVESPDQLALVMEYVDGQNLQKQLREQLVPFSQRLQWLTQIAQGLAIAHDAGIIHRDLKPENILINRRGDAKISDLGIAKSQDYNATLTDHVAGSYCSMSPEQAMGESISFKSDLFSLGILAYQLLCGAHPFGDTSNKLQVMQRIISHPPVPPTKHNPDLAPDIINLLGQLLSKNPDNRPDNTHWVAAQFEQLNKQHQEQPLTLDDTLALTAPALAAPTSGTGYTRSPLRNTQEHPTFDTAYINQAALKPGLGSRLKTYCKANAASLSMLGLALVLVGAIAAWQLQPKPPQYVAVIPPTLSADGMQESQQELVKGAVYDAIQQSVIQLDGYYLIPRSEVIDANGDLETIRSATAADELLTTEIHCKIEACSIRLVRMGMDLNQPNSRLRIIHSNSIDVLADNYVSLASITQNSLGKLFPDTTTNTFINIDAEGYKKFLEINHKYRAEGESQELLSALDQLASNIKKLEATQSLYSDIALDLHHETQNDIFLTKAEQLLEQYGNKKQSQEQLLNLFKIRSAQGRLNEAREIVDKIKQQESSESSIHKLNAYINMAEKDYKKAIYFYTKAATIKNTANISYQNAIAHWHSGDTEGAKKLIQLTLSMSPNFYNALSMSGTISLLEGDFEAAIHAYNNIHQKTPQDTFNLSNLGLAYLFHHDYEKALELFKKAYQLAPDNLAFALNMADALNLTDRDEEAQETYKRIASTESDNHLKDPFLKERAQAYAHIGDFSKALLFLRELEKANSQSIETIYTAALIHALAQNNAAAIFNIQNAITGGMNSGWFNLPWFAHLCEVRDFYQILKTTPNSLCSSL